MLPAVFVREPSFAPFRSFAGDPVGDLLDVVTRMLGATQTGGPAHWTPAMDVQETATEYRFTAEVAGIPAEQLNVEVREGILAITGERREETHVKKEGDAVRRSERRYGRFERRFRLPPDARGDAITASLENGVLTVSVPRTEEPKPRRIEIASGR